ncbi:MAG: cupin domain-containing protein [Firmicutes bacterium]|nr:cupin domain-containing protein [Bacillota bacterium]
MDPQSLIKTYSMTPHAEGGHYAEIGKMGNGAASQIYYLLQKGETANWHRLQSEELWLYHDGGSVTITLGGTAETPQPQTTAVLNKEHPSFLIPSGQWQMATAENEAALLSCIVCPAFTWDQWELYQKGE